MKKENLKVTFTAGRRSSTITSDELHGLVSTLGKEERVDACPRCHLKHFEQWIWLDRVMHKCLGCGRIWSYEE